MYGQAYVIAFEKLSFALKCENASFRFTEGTERTDSQEDVFSDLSGLVVHVWQNEMER